MALPALAALNAAQPIAALDVFVGAHSRPVFEGQPGIAALQRVGELLTLPRAQRLGWRLRRGRYDWVVALDRSRALRLAGRFAQPARFAAAQVQAPETRHEAQVYLDALAPLGIVAPLAPPRLVLSDDERAAAVPFVPATPFVVLHPGGAENPGARMPEKRWPAERYAELARSLVADGLLVLLSGGAGDVARCRDVARSARLPETCVLAGALSLRVAAALLERATLFVGPDTGMSHIAAAVGAPTVAIFGPTNPRRYRPLGPRVRVVAAPGAWDVPDADLRRPRPIPPNARIGLVSVADVRAACDALPRQSAGSCA